MPLYSENFIHFITVLNGATTETEECAMDYLDETPVVAKHPRQHIPQDVPWWMTELSRRVVRYANTNQTLPRNTTLDATATVNALMRDVRSKGLRPLLKVMDYQKDSRSDQQVMVDYAEAVSLFESCIYPSLTEASTLSRDKKIIQLLITKFPSSVWAKYMRFRSIPKAILPYR